jgi:hypothetical protein
MSAFSILPSKASPTTVEVVFENGLHEVTKAQGHSFEAFVKIVDAPEFTQFIVEITWDSDVLELETGTEADVIQGDFLGGEIFVVAGIEPGHIGEVTEAKLAGTASGTGTAFKIKFHVKASGDSEIHLERAILLNGLIYGDIVPSDPIDGLVHAHLLVHDIAATGLMSSYDVVARGNSLPMNGTFQNRGNYTETFNATIYANTTIIITLVDIILTSGGSIIVPFEWNTSGFATGNYTVKAIADTVPGEVETFDNTFVDDWIFITKVGDLGGDLPPSYFNFDNEVDGIDLALFIQCYKGNAPFDAMYLADLGGGIPPQFFNYDGVVDGLDLALWIECYKGNGPDT